MVNSKLLDIIYSSSEKLQFYSSEKWQFVKVCMLGKNYVTWLYHAVTALDIYTVTNNGCSARTIRDRITALFAKKSQILFSKL